MTELRQSPIRFDEEKHEYWLDDRQLQGVTSTLLRRAYPDKYKDVDQETLNKAAAKGKELHRLIEFHDSFSTNAEEHEDQRVVSYERLKAAHGLTTIANEYLVSDCEHYASAIDVVMEDKDGGIYLADIKTTWDLDRPYVALQLSIYKRFFEQQNPGLKVRGLFAIWLPNKDHTIAEMNPLMPIADDVISQLIEADLADQPFDITVSYGTLPVFVRNVQDEVVRIITETKRLKEQEDILKKGLYQQMEEVDCKCFDSDMIRLTRVLPTESETFDTKLFQTEHPELYQQYLKKTKRAGSLKITIK